MEFDGISNGKLLDVKFWQSKNYVKPNGELDFLGDMEMRREVQKMIRKSQYAKAHGLDYRIHVPSKEVRDGFQEYWNGRYENNPVTFVYTPKK